MNLNTQQTKALTTFFLAQKQELETKGLTNKQVFGVLFNKEYINKSGIIFTLKSVGLVNSIFLNEPESVDVDF